jgi:hypothetical protein
MTLKDLLKKKGKSQEGSSQPEDASLEAPLETPIPEFTFLRTTSTSEEVIVPPSFPGDQPIQPKQEPHRRVSRFRRHTNAAHSPPNDQPSSSLDAKPELGRRLSERLHLGRSSRSASTSSVNIPESLPKEPEGGAAKGEEEEAEWEKRATLLAKSNPNVPEEGGNSSVSLSDATGDVRHILYCD